MFSILVIVPTLNSYHLLPRLVKSLQDQSYSGWRVLFIDGKSSQIHKDWLQNQCNKDSRFNWEEEIIGRKGIFAAMNQGFKHAAEDDWVLFWGSDDIAQDKDVFRTVGQKLSSMAIQPDLYICCGRYYSSNHLLEGYDTLRMQRFSRFRSRKTFRESLFWGSTPPHQATFFGPGARKQLSSYDEGFRLAGDLDYFLRLSRLEGIRIFVDNIVLVLMGDSGVSAKESKRRITEVVFSYKKAFGSLWFFPFLSRYWQRLWSILTKA
jgi:glycosyltransferase involved in cell wall biosynthesis